MNNHHSTLKRECPICNGRSGTILNTQKFLLPENHPLKDGYDVVVCDRCGFVYADTEATQADYDRFYNSFSKYEEGANIIGSGDSPYDYSRLHATANYLASRLPHSTRVLDIGSANGGLLREMGKLGFKSLSAYDPSQFCVDYIKKHLGIEANHGSIFEIREKFARGNQFDLVILSHVLEHLLEVSEAFEQIDCLLAPGSFLYLEVPDASKYTEYFVSPLHYFDTEHINHFSNHYLELLAEKFGLAVIDSGQKEISLSDNTVYPAIFVLLQRTANSSRNSFEPRFDDRLEGNIKRYIEKSVNSYNIELIKKISASAIEYIFWGVGSTTLRLLASTDLGKARIKFFVDNNTKTHSLNVLGKNVFPPEEIKKHNNPIVVFSKIYKNEIVEQIRNELNVSNEIIFLH